MSAFWICAIVCACVFCSAMLGMALRSLLPDHHLSGDSKDILKIGTGMIATLAALVLGLLVSSAKGKLDDANKMLTDFSAKAMMLDRTLARLGPESLPLRKQMAAGYAQGYKELFATDPNERGKLDTAEAEAKAEQLTIAIRQLPAETDLAKEQKAKALGLREDLYATRWQLVAERQGTISYTLMAIMVFWLCVNYLSLGLFAPRNATVLTTIFLCALSMSGAIFLILEMSSPLDGVIHISPEPLKAALEHIKP